MALQNLYLTILLENLDFVNHFVLHYVLQRYITLVKAEFALINKNKIM